MLGKLFPGARVRRMDADTMKRKEDYRKTLGDFRIGKTDILVGTQMIAKGLHFPNVTLVGIIYADLALHQPDFEPGSAPSSCLPRWLGAPGAATWRARCLCRRSRRFIRPSNTRAVTISPAFTTRKSSSANS